MTRYIETFFRHKVLLITPLVLTLLLSGWYVSKQPTTYTTSTAVWFDNQLPNPGYLDPMGSNGPAPSATAQTLLGQLLSTQAVMLTHDLGPGRTALNFAVIVGPGGELLTATGRFGKPDTG